MRSSGLIDHAEPRHKSAAWRAAHGTHVLDLAAGYDPAGPIPDRPIIAVQLPTPVVAQTTGERLDFHVALATYYILDRVWRLSENRPPPPVVINTSFGYIAGPHDGTGVVERFFEFVTANAQSPTRIVLPAGNAQLSRCHAVIDLVTHARCRLRVDRPAGRPDPQRRPGLAAGPRRQPDDDDGRPAGRNRLAHRSPIRPGSSGFPTPA